MTERLMVATASSDVISAAALAAVAPDPDRAPDQLSARWMLGLALEYLIEAGDGGTCVLRYVHSGIFMDD
jgi:hypothetical protein